jgi:competence protein ComEA
MRTLMIVRRAASAVALLCVVSLSLARPVSAGDAPDPVDVNRATVDELMEIPGVGEATAERIVKGRPYASLDDLAKAGLSEKAIAKIRPHLKVGKAKSGGDKPVAPSGKVDLNKASAEELMALPGVGEAIAKKIVEGRPYSSIGDLSKAGLGEKLIEKLTPLVTVGKAKAEDDKPAGKSGDKPTSENPAAPAGKVDLNKATEEELLALPGVGEATAAKIVKGRPYASVDDLEGAGLSERLIDKLTPFVTAGDSSTPTPRADPAPGGGRGLVWANTNTGVFHRETSRWYGRTKAGKYMTEAAAKKEGFHESGKPPPDEDDTSGK